MKNKIIAANIKRFRNIKGISQKVLAERSGVTTLSISNLERGISEPKTSTLLNISKVLEVPLQNFFKPVPELRSVRFRTHKSLSGREKDARAQLLIDIAYWLKNFNWLEKELNAEQSNLFSGFSAKGSPELVAEKARKLLSISENEVIKDISSLMEKAGIKIYQTPSSLKKFFGLSIGEEDGGPAICINTSREIAVERQIFTAAHELGHLLMHKSSYKQNDLLETEKEETQANAFASYFLMPQEPFLKEWEENKGLFWIDRVLHVKRIFKVSYKTVLFRLSEMRKRENLYILFNIEYKKRYNHDLKNFYEPDALVKSDFIEDRLPFLVRMAYEKELISLSRAAEILKKSASEMRDLRNSWDFIE